MWSGREDDALTNDPRHNVFRVRCNGKETSLLYCADYYTYGESYIVDAATTRCNYHGYLGCYNSYLGYPVLPDIGPYGITDYEMTIQWCLNYCRERNMTYAGLNDKKYCFCGLEGAPYDRLNREANDKCDYECMGDDSQMCGGFYEFGIYRTSLGACGGQVEAPGTVYSPGFPGYYTDELSCSWTITSPAPTVINLMFSIHDFIGEEQFNIFEISNGSHYDLKFSNNKTTSCSNVVHLQFQTNSDTAGGRGMFALEISDVIPDCQPPSGLLEETRFKYNYACHYFHGDNISIECKTGYELRSSHHVIECQQNGTWNDSLPVCTVTDCGDPGELKNANRWGNIFTYNSTVIYECHDGFYGDEDSIVVCTVNGNWTTKPVCLRKSCGDPGDVENATRQGDDFTYNNTVTYTCHEGFHSDGDIVISCTSDGHWTNKPTCLEIEAEQETVVALSTAVVAGSVTGVVVLIVVVAAALVGMYIFRRRMQPCRKHEHDENSEEITVQNEEMAYEVISGKDGVTVSQIRMQDLNVNSNGEKTVNDAKVVEEDTGEQIIYHDIKEETTKNTHMVEPPANVYDNMCSYDEERIRAENNPYEISDDAVPSVDNTYYVLDVTEDTPEPKENRENGGFTDKHTMEDASVLIKNIAYESVDDICADKMDDTNRDDTVRGMKENIAYESFDAGDNDEDEYATLE
ncbi:uncharacterized protein LOC144448476 [Glandiceps talaboti]